jgi:hypothetical protein
MHSQGVPICESLLNSSTLRPMKPLNKSGLVACMVGELQLCLLDATEILCSYRMGNLPEGGSAK